MKYWLVKQEPESYAWAKFVREGRAAWTGVRNYAARLHLRAMASGDLVLYYHSGDEKAVVGIASVKRPAYPDPTAEEGDWVCVDLAPVKPLVQPVSLAVIKADDLLKQMVLVRQTRLSVVPMTPKEFSRVLKLGETAA
jgi:predicted RNA-binding protein with PUA-like domain